MTKAANVRLICMTAFNVIGIVLFLSIASDCWIEPELANEPGASGGDAIVWGSTALPILAGFFLFDLVWLTVECVAYWSRKVWRLSLASLFLTFVVIPLAWFIAAYVDNSHHGI
jgi:hypothetical protein